MRTVVMKFGGAAMADPQRIQDVAKIVADRSKHGERIAVVVSAMGDTTDQLIKLAKEIHCHPPRRELDMLVSVGERISMSLLAMALANFGCDAQSYTGSQSGIITCDRHTDATIVDVRPRRLSAAFETGKVVIVAGFQGVSRGGEITTLGRGGSDTTAVALGVALRAASVEFYKDVQGVYEKDPKSNAQAKLIPQLSYEEMLVILSEGAKVLHKRSVELAAKNNLPLYVRSFLHSSSSLDSQGTWIGLPNLTLVEVPRYEESEISNIEKLQACLKSPVG